ncbi:MAG TPA: hypothetical protein VJ901_23050, partial [Thermoanaerobaculia bacterium]|nr:hypothetical protein [Thermoanaerobaculia bacterium]
MTEERGRPRPQSASVSLDDKVRARAGRPRTAGGTPALLALLNVILYRKAVRLWWTYDDPFNLHAVLTHRLLDPFVNRAIWPQQLFTPLMMTAF